jgi:DNA invertase Pin-like site-specific DNA recombinase
LIVDVNNIVDAINMRLYYRIGGADMRAAIYGRVSTVDQHVTNQIIECERYTAARGWFAVQYVDHGISGAKDSRPALDAMLKDARRRRFDVLVVWRLDRLGRSLKHLVNVLDDLSVLGVSFVSLGESLDTTTPAGKLQLHMIAAFSEFERGRIQERVRAGLARVRAQGKRLGRPRSSALPTGVQAGLTVRDAAKQWGVSKSTAARWLAAGTMLGTNPRESTCESFGRFAVVKADPASGHIPDCPRQE